MNKLYYRIAFLWYNSVIMTAFEYHTRHPDWPIAVRLAPHDSTDYHSHPFSELVLVVKGKGFHRYRNDEREVKRGDVIFIPPGDEHGYYGGQDLVVYNALFRAEKIPAFPGDLVNLEGYHALCHADGAIRRQVSGTRGIRLDGQTLERLEGVMARIDRELAESPPGWQTETLSLFYRLFSDLCRSINAVNSSNRLMKGAEIMAFLDNHYGRELTLESLADGFAMSVSTFQRFFRENLGQPPMGYLRDLRLRKAALRLERGDDSLAEIAQECGFYDASHFGRLFKKYWGMTPGDYLRKSG